MGAGALQVSTSRISRNRGSSAKSSSLMWRVE